MPARWLMFATLSLGFGLGIAGATSWCTPSGENRSGLPSQMPTPYVIVERGLPIVIEITAIPTITRTPSPIPTRLPLMSPTPTATPTPPMKSDRPTDAEVTTR